MAYADSLKIPRTMTAAEVAKLQKTTGDHRDGFRDHVLYAMALHTGLREMELVALDVGDVLSEGGTAKRHVRLRVYKGSEPGEQPPEAQEVVLSEQVRVLLQRLYRNKVKDGESVAPDAPLFVSRQHRRLSTRMVRHGFGVWQERAGLERHFTFHQLRHTAITRIYHSTKNIMLAKRFARHSSLQSTQIYTHVSDEELARAVNAIGF